MGWFSNNRKPFSREFCARLDRLEAAVSDSGNDSGETGRSPEVIPVEILSSTSKDGEDLFAWREITTSPNDTGGRSSYGFLDEGPPDEYAFAAKLPMEGESFVVKHWVSIPQDDGQGGTYPLHDIKYTIVGGGASAAFEARIETPTQIGNDARWQYDWVEVAWDPAQLRFVEFEGGRSSIEEGKAINTLESSNTPQLAYGISVTAGGGTFYIHDTSQQYEFKPVPGTVVTMRVRPAIGGGNVIVFSAPNPIDGQCA